ncbi:MULTISPECIES: Asp23/Gls24 family envelope stress response protein [unclassified Frankia]
MNERERVRPGRPAGRRSGAGSLRVADRVVEKIAAMAAADVVGVTGPPRRFPRRGGARRRGRAGRPRVSAKMEGATARLTMSFSVRYPIPVTETAELVRCEVRDRVAALTGVRVAHLDIEIPSLSSDG